MRASLFLLLGLCCGAAVVMGQTCSNVSSLTVQGTGSAEAQPDIAKVTLKVESTKESAGEARDVAAKVAVKVVEAVAAVPGVFKDDITTLDVSVQPQYDYSNSGSAPKITGYTFLQRIQVKVTNLTNDVLSGVIDVAVKTGGNNLRLEGIQAELGPELKLETTNTAREAAVEDAKSAAQVLAKASSVNLGQIRSVIDGSVVVPTPYTPVSNAGGAPEADKAISTPINIGTTEVTATVTIIYNISE